MTTIRLIKLMAGIAFGVALVFGTVQPSIAQDNAAKLAKYKKEHKTFRTKSGQTYQTSGISKVTATGASVITDDGIVRIKPDDLPDDLRKAFGLSAEKVKAAEAAYARKRYDSKKANFRKKNAQRSVSARKFRLSLKVVEEIEFGAICDAQFMEEQTKAVTRKVRPGTLDRDRKVRTKEVKVKTQQAVGVVEKMLVRGLPRSLKSGSPWEGDVYMVGTFVYEEKSRIPGRTGPPPVDIPMAFVRYNEAVAYRAATPLDGSEGNSSGTGVVISEAGYIMTNYRLVLEADRILATIPGHNQPLKATVVAKDPEENLAVLKVKSKLKAAPITMTPRVTLGQEVFTVGYPDTDMKSRQMKIEKGNVAALKGVQEDIRFIQVEGDFQAGNFGGAIFDKKGIVIGIITPNPPESFFLEEQGSGFAPLQYVTKGTRFKNLLAKLPGFKVEKKAPKNAIAAAQETAVLITVKRNKR